MSVWQMSVSASLLILAVTAVRALWKYHLPKRLFPALWCVALIRLIAPFSFPVRFFTPMKEWAQGMGGNDVGRMISSDMVIGRAWEFPAISAPHQGISPWLVIWIAGAALCAGFYLISYIVGRKDFSMSLPIENAFVDDWQAANRIRRPVRVRVSDRIQAPLTYGVVCPVILLPRSIKMASPKYLAYVLSHEMAHIRRFDALVKLLMAAALCVHWFNPLVWLMCALLNRDIELACDEAVMDGLEGTQKLDYAMMLISMERVKGNFLPLFNGFSRYAIEERIHAIMRMKKISVWGIILSGCLLISSAAVFATAEAPDTPAPTRNPWLEDLEPPMDAETWEAPEPGGPVPIPLIPGREVSLNPATGEIIPGPVRMPSIAGASADADTEEIIAGPVPMPSITAARPPMDSDAEDIE